jgi:predicted lipid-binding transport protein (Tim44 family)
MTGDNDSNAPQFATAEYTQPSEGDQCAGCKQRIVGSYYRVNGNMACASCAEQALRETPKDVPANFMRALLFGIGAAVLGLVLYAGFEIMTGWIIGFVALAVGWLVGKAMMMGSKGFGGRKYQITAALLTYAAVSMAAIPVMIAHYAKEKPAQQTTSSQQEQVNPPEQQNAGADGAEKEASPKSFGAAMLYLAGIGLISPFLELADPLHGLIGLVILYVGVNIAWKLAAGSPQLQVSGPFDAA